MDVIKVGGSQGYYLIEFFRSEHKSKLEAPIFVAEWKFLTESERNESLRSLIKEHGTRINIKHEK
ncbi:hypothetical protein GCM10007423_63830 [Dyadobacter endophyticus]|uniref:Uncharacterized protein n=1 Tax=Dyadobacter endophyticus TaxID=1749036 RepID=A0ABQ1ZDP1_9BACT|nr:hypothetical protein GCM10007423_63830 [Dyadobacter endophyticus]